MLRFRSTSLLQTVADAIDEVAFHVDFHVLGFPPAAGTTLLPGRPPQKTQRRRWGGEGRVFIHSFIVFTRAKAKGGSQPSGHGGPVADMKVVAGRIPGQVHNGTEAYRYKQYTTHVNNKRDGKGGKATLNTHTHARRLRWVFAGGPRLNDHSGARPK